MLPSSPVDRPYATKIINKIAKVTLMPRPYTVLLPCPLSLKRKNKLEARLTKIPAINKMIIGLTDITLVLYR